MRNIMRRTIGKYNNAKKHGKQGEKKRMMIRWIDSIKEAIAWSMQDLNRDVSDRTFWRSEIHRLILSHK